MDWWSFVDNKDALIGPFRGEPPPLVDLRLVQILFDPSSVHACLEFNSAPPGRPTRWLAKGHDALQLRISLDFTSSIVARGDVSKLCGSTVSVELTPGRFVLSQPAEYVEVDIHFQQAHAVFHSFNGREAVDFQDVGWFRVPY